MSLRCEDVARAGLGEPAKRSGRELLYNCPRHGPEKHPSLKINVEKNCWLCGPCQASGTAWALAAFLAACDPSDKPNVVAWLKAHNLLSPSDNKRKILAAYDYRDENRNLLFQVIRYAPKSFAQRRPDGKGGWTWDMKGVRRVPYRLPEVINAREVFIPEGEKDADRLASVGLAATTNPGGAGKWLPEFAQYFAGKQVNILSDNDETGRRHVEDVARNVCSTAELVKIVDLPGLPPKGDLSGWLDAGRSVEELVAFVREAPAWQARNQVTDGIATSAESGPTSGRGRILHWEDIPTLADLPNVEIEWAVQDMVPRGGITLFTGKSGEYKTWLAELLCRGVASGGTFLDRSCAFMDVLYLDRENPVAVVKYRALLLDLEGLPNLRYWGGWLRDQPPYIEDPRVLEIACTRKPLIVVDSLIRFHRSDENSATEMAVVMRHLRALANAGATVVIPHHRSKAEESKF